MAIVINGSTGITATESSSVLGDNAIETADIAANAVTAAKLASTLDLTGKTVTLPAGAGGKVLQVVSATKTDIASVTGTTFVDISGLSVSLTPSSASNKVLIIFNIYITNSGASTRFATKLVRNSTNIAVADADGSRVQATTGGITDDTSNTGEMYANSMNFLDSPATTSSTTYKIQWASIDGTTTYLNRGSLDTDASSVQRVVSSITAMEIAA